MQNRGDLDETVAAASDVSVLLAYADTDRLQILQLLCEGPRTQKELSAALSLNSGTLSRQMAALEAAGLVIRERSHGPYALIAPSRTIQLLQVANGLVAEAERTRLAASEERGQALQRIADLQQAENGERGTG